MNATQRQIMREIMTTAWQFIKRNGFTPSEALKTAWTNYKLRAAMHVRIVKFYFQKVDGTIREAYGTLKTELLPYHEESNRRRNDTVQVFFDTENQGWRSYKKANLIKIA